MSILSILTATAQGAGWVQFIPFILIFVIMWFFMIRPQQKRQKEIQNFRNSISVGTDVVTAGGIYGVVRSMDETTNTLQIEIAKGVTIKVDRNSVYASVATTPAAGK